MTNQEAIEELKKVDTLDMPARLCEAHYMAIKALNGRTIIPGNTTNGDVMWMIFPFMAVKHDIRNKIRELSFTDEWWDSPYEDGSDKE